MSSHDRIRAGRNNWLIGAIVLAVGLVGAFALMGWMGERMGNSSHTGRVAAPMTEGSR